MTIKPCMRFHRASRFPPRRSLVLLPHVLPILRHMHHPTSTAPICTATVLRCTATVLPLYCAVHCTAGAHVPQRGGADLTPRQAAVPGPGPAVPGQAGAGGGDSRGGDWPWGHAWVGSSCSCFYMSPCAAYHVPRGTSIIATLRCDLRHVLCVSMPCCLRAQPPTVGWPLSLPLQSLRCRSAFQAHPQSPSCTHLPPDITHLIFCVFSSFSAFSTGGEDTERPSEPLRRAVPGVMRLRWHGWVPAHDTSIAALSLPSGWFPSHAFSL